MKEIAYLAMFGFPIFAVIIFSRTSLQAAICWTLAVGFVFLPQGISIDPPLLPAYNRSNAPLAMALVLAILVAKGRGWRPDSTGETPYLKSWLPRSPLGKALIIGLLMSPVLTLVTNTTPVAVGGGRSIQGLGLRDLGSMGYAALAVVINVAIGRRYLSDAEGRWQLLKVLGLIGLICAPFIAYEWRMSPQLHEMIYGSRPFGWLKIFRFGGWRPVLFQSDGLVTAAFTAGAFVAFVAAARQAPAASRALWQAGLGVFAVAIVMLNAFGGWLLAAIFAPVAFFLRRNLQLSIAAALAALVMVYPLTQITTIFPNDQVVGAARLVATQRAESLDFRFRAERAIIGKTAAKPLFGWGIWSRGRVYDKDGNDISVTDSLWILRYMTFGLFGYATFFGMMCLPVLAIYRRRRRMQIDYTVTGLMVAQCVFLTDQLVNDTANPFMWLIAGSLLGMLERARDTASTAPDVAQAEAEEAVQPALARRASPASAARDATTPIRPVESEEEEAAPALTDAPVPRGGALLRSSERSSR